MNGCDVASYQGTIDFDALKAEAGFLIAKSSEGTGFTDPTFARNRAEARRVGMRFGAYHFARPDLGTTADNEAAFFLSHLDGKDDMLALDYEVNFASPVPWCNRFLDLVRTATGITPYIYLNLALVRGNDWGPVIEAGYPLWLADYDGSPDVVPQTPWPSLAMKQWTSDGSLPGIGGRVDLNVLYKEDDADMVSKAEFQAYQEDVRNSLTAIKDALWALQKQVGDAEAKAVIEAQLGVLDSALKPKP